MGGRRSSVLHRESEKPTLFGPGERHRTQEPLEGQGAGLLTFGDGFHDVGRKESKSQGPPDVSFTQVACAIVVNRAIASAREPAVGKFRLVRSIEPDLCALGHGTLDPLQE